MVMTLDMGANHRAFGPVSQQSTVPADLLLKLAHYASHLLFIGENR